MKLLKWSLFLLLTAVGFTACQKELEGDNSGTAIGTFKKDAAGDCFPVKVNGIYRVDSTLKTDNIVDVEVIVTSAGNFDIKSDTVNGYSFSKSGNAGNGPGTIRLRGSGKPIAAGTNTFTVKFGTSSCTFDVTVVGASTGVAVFTLGGAPGNCANFTVNGTYTNGVTLDATHSVSFTVDVSSPGTYTFSTANTSGFGFSGTGVFTGTGPQTISLMGSGTPNTSGPIVFSPTTGPSTCTFTVTVAPSGPGTAVYTLDGSPGNCSGAIINGTYTAGTTVTAANTVAVQVNVGTIGTYNITTNTNNGISFTKTGSFTITGPQAVILTATGSPTVAGIFNYTVTAGAATCTFSVTTIAGSTPPSTNLDYLPQTPFSNWSARLVGGGPGDTSYTQASPNTKAFSGNAYRIFEILDMGNPIDSLYQRKAGTSYYQYIDEDFGILDAPLNKEVLLLDSTAAVGATWTINLGNYTAGGIPVTAKFKGEILAKGATATIAGNTYNMVIKVKYSYIGNIGFGDIVFAEEERWYAKGYGMIYDKLNDVPVTTTQEFETTRTQVF